MRMTTAFLALASVLLGVPMLFAQEQLGGPEVDRQKERLQAVGRAKVQLALKLQVRESKLTLDSATAATWPDASLGCPEKGHMYAQVVTRGWRVILQLDGVKHEVHVSGRRAVVCDKVESAR